MLNEAMSLSVHEDAESAPTMKAGNSVSAVSWSTLVVDNGCAAPDQRIAVGTLAKTALGVT
jgi:hypothetical protein